MLVLVLALVLVVLVLAVLALVLALLLLVVMAVVVVAALAAAVVAAVVVVVCLLIPWQHEIFVLAGHCTSITYKNCLQICLEFPCLRKMVLVRSWLPNGVMVQWLVADADPWHQTTTIAADCHLRPFLRMV